MPTNSNKDQNKKVLAATQLLTSERISNELGLPTSSCLNIQKAFLSFGGAVRYISICEGDMLTSQWKDANSR